MVITMIRSKNRKKQSPHQKKQTNIVEGWLINKVSFKTSFRSDRIMKQAWKWSKCISIQNYNFIFPQSPFTVKHHVYPGRYYWIHLRTIFFFYWRNKDCGTKWKQVWLNLFNNSYTNLSFSMPKIVFFFFNQSFFH